MKFELLAPEPMKLPKPMLRLDGEATSSEIVFVDLMTGTLVPLKVCDRVMPRLAPRFMSEIAHQQRVRCR